jgi:hypothetical protein
MSVDLNGATAGARGQQSTLQDYFMRIAQGQGETGADQLLRNAQGAASRNLQSASVSAGGNNPALALRQMLGAQSAVQGDIAGKSAAQKLQEQQQYGNMAANNAGQMYQQDFQRAQQDYANKMSNVQARQDIANGIFSAQRSQTSLNADYDKSRMAFENWKYEAAKQAEQDRARAAAVLPEMAIKFGLGVGASALGGGLAGAIGGAAGQAAGGAASAAGGGLADMNLSGAPGSSGYMPPSPGARVGR